MYAEDERRNGRGWIRYSVILSNEDGGTPPPALMARWGRTTDIELIYEVEWTAQESCPIGSRGPTMKFARSPVRETASIRTSWSPRSTTCSSIAGAASRTSGRCRLSSTSRGTRESVMDDHPWIYPLMARELVAEKRIGTQIEDPREFLYVEAGLALEGAAASASRLGCRRMAGFYAGTSRSRGQSRRLGPNCRSCAVARRDAEMGVPGTAGHSRRHATALPYRVGTRVPSWTRLPAGREPDLARHGPDWRRPQRGRAALRFGPAR